MGDDEMPEAVEIRPELKVVEREPAASSTPPTPHTPGSS